MVSPGPMGRTSLMLENFKTSAPFKGALSRLEYKYKMIIPIYKPIGESSHQIAKKVGEKYNQKATHTGTLDPMAKGVLVVLTGEDRLNKSKYSDWQKTYKFKILVGIGTDSHDLLGLTKNISDKKINIKDLEKNIFKFVGKQTQKVPSFSAQRINGLSGFDLAKQNKRFKQQENKIEVFSLEIKEEETISNKDLLTYIEENINLVKGDFRQTEILKNWNEVLKEEKEFQLITLESITSKRTYIRSIVRDIGIKLNIPITTFSINRTKNGQYNLKDCLEL
jgi:tRNA pseudouridine(55) synthase